MPLTYTRPQAHMRKRVLYKTEDRVAHVSGPQVLARHDVRIFAAV